MPTNRGHRPKGHKTRGIHKVVPNGKPTSKTAESAKSAKKGWTTRPCPNCGDRIPVRRFVSQKNFHDHVRDCPSKNPIALLTEPCYSPHMDNPHGGGFAPPPPTPPIDEYPPVEEIPEVPVIENPDTPGEPTPTTPPPGNPGPPSRGPSFGS